MSQKPDSNTFATPISEKRQQPDKTEMDSNGCPSDNTQSYTRQHMGRDTTNDETRLYYFILVEHSREEKGIIHGL
ncbi:hypothetical protein TWF481_008924 [Arthrobotrys musiformis]|uniref:Uncharacterized protein n=1 Tax=Arthrobotrys musiformis TaxID=47236 RepID=A0AAV9W280_9PEZI